MFVASSSKRAAVIDASAQIAALRAELVREPLARRQIETWTQNVADLERALQLHLQQVERLRNELARLRDVVVDTITALVDAHDPSINQHAQAVTACAVQIAEELDLDPTAVEEVRLAALLHDIGKIGIAEAVLNKPGPLDEEEWRAMREHPIVAQRLLDGLPLPTETMRAIRHHHERFDGRGYPDHVAGTSIPLGARIVAVADAYHAMTSDRPYSRRRSTAAACGEILRCAGAHFCPQVVTAFLTIAARPEFAEESSAA